MSKRTKKQKDLTRLVHAGRDPACQHGFVNENVLFFNQQTITRNNVAGIQDHNITRDNFFDRDFNLFPIA